MRGCILWIPNQRQGYPSAATDSAGLSSGTGEVEVFSLFHARIATNPDGRSNSGSNYCTHPLMEITAKFFTYA